MEGNGKTGEMSKIRVTIDDAVFQKIMYWVRLARGECSGLGKIVFDKDGTIRVTSAVLLKQQNGSTSTEIDPQAIGKAMFELRNEPGFLNFWWHSHVNMNVFWSGTDRDTIREIGSQGFVLATVFNKKCETKSAFYTKATEVLPELFLDDLDTTVERFLPDSLRDQWKAEFDEKCQDRYSWDRSSEDKKKSEPQTTLWPDGYPSGSDEQTTMEKMEAEAEDQSRFNDPNDIDKLEEIDANDRAKHDAIRDDLHALEKEIEEAATSNMASKALRESYMMINSTRFSPAYAEMLRSDMDDVFKENWTPNRPAPGQSQFQGKVPL